MVLADLPIGILYILAITSSLGVYGIVLAGWSSNNKYALLGGLRASAQMISYEIALGLSAVAVFMLAGNVTLTAIVAGQQQSVLMWYVFPLGPRASSCSWSPPSRRPTACRSTCPRPSPSWSPAITPNTAS